MPNIYFVCLLARLLFLFKLFICLFVRLLVLLFWNSNNNKKDFSSDSRASNRRAKFDKTKSREIHRTYPITVFLLVFVWEAKGERGGTRTDETEVYDDCLPLTSLGLPQQAIVLFQVVHEIAHLMKATKSLGSVQRQPHTGMIQEKEKKDELLEKELTDLFTTI